MITKEIINKKMRTNTERVLLTNFTNCYSERYKIEQNETFCRSSYIANINFVLGSQIKCTEDYIHDAYNYLVDDIHNLMYGEILSQLAQIRALIAYGDSASALELIERLFNEFEK